MIPYSNHARVEGNREMGTPCGADSVGDTVSGPDRCVSFCAVVFYFLFAALPF
jgi:hypothetical protein